MDGRSLIGPMAARVGAPFSRTEFAVDFGPDGTVTSAGELVRPAPY